MRVRHSAAPRFLQHSASGIWAPLLLVVVQSEPVSKLRHLKYSDSGKPSPFSSSVIRSRQFPCALRLLLAVEG